MGIIDSEMIVSRTSCRQIKLEVFEAYQTIITMNYIICQENRVIGTLSKMMVIWTMSKVWSYGPCQKRSLGPYQKRS